jgi:4-diphosphocytidyl-2-C-methyl-D-erythritol kinase
VAERFDWPAPAKLNLFLHVTRRRDDGYHELQTLYQILEWGDRLQVEPGPAGGKIRRSTVHPDIPEAEDLCIRAARLLQAECGCRRGATIGIEKRIPPGSGLGGGSSDAATVLHVLNRYWGCGLSATELADLGLRLGADVPVFVHGHSAWAEGIGERLRATELGERHYVLVFPGEGIATRDVFTDPLLPRDTPARAFSELDPQACRNDCERVVLARHPVLSRVMAELSEYGCPRLSGTGSCIFLPVAGAAEAAGTTSRLKSRYNVRAVRGVDRSPLLEKLSVAR